MQQRRRPSGTDGSDYSYRMVVDSRYQLVAKGKKRLSVLLPLQAVFLLIGVMFAVLPGIEEDTPNMLALTSVVCGLITLGIAEFGRRRSKASFLGIYTAASSLTMLLAVNLAKRHALIKVIRESSFWQTRKLVLSDFPALQAGLVVHIIALFLVQFLITKTAASLISSMSPPTQAKAS